MRGQGGQQHGGGNRSPHKHAVDATSTQLHRLLQIESTQAESQWIVGQAYSQHLQYLEAIKSSAKDLSLPIFEIAMDQKAHMK